MSDEAVRIHPDDARYCPLGVERGNPQPHEAHEFHYRFDGPDGLVAGAYYCGGATEGDRVRAAGATDEFVAPWRRLAEQGLEFASLLLTTPGVVLLDSERKRWEQIKSDYEALLATDFGSGGQS